jgi:DNA (cytosine-5)-methyltransferase 1
VLLAWLGTAKPDLNYPPTTLHATLRSALQGLCEGVADHEINRLPARSRKARIAGRIGPGQKLCNVRAGPTAVHTWDIPQVFGGITKTQRQLLETLMRLRRTNRVRDFGDADPVTAKLIANELGRPVRHLLLALEQKGYVRRVNGRYDLVNTFNGTFRRLCWDRPSPTVHTRFGNPRFFLHPEEHRGFTIREAARIQGFPDSFRFTGDRASKYRLIGNAVPPLLAMWLAQRAGRLGC